MSGVHDRLKGRSTRLVMMMLLTGSYFVAELVTGYITKSNALVADSFHMLSDLLALMVAFSTIRIAKRATEKNTFGWARAEILGALINAVFLLALCFKIFLDAIERFVKPENIQNVDMLLIVGGVGLGVNLIGMCLFHDHAHHGHHQSQDHEHGHKQKRHLQQQDDQRTQPNVDEKQQKQQTRRSSKRRSLELVHPEEIIIPSSPAIMMRYPERAINDIIAELQDADKSSGSVDRMSRTDLQLGSMDQSMGQPDCGNGEKHGDDGKDCGRREKSNSGVHSGGSLNIKGVFLHIVADALGSVVVMISGSIVKWVPKNSQASTIPLLRESALILLQTVPSHINASKLQRQLLNAVPEIEEIHDFHIWQLNANKIIGSAHVKRRSLANYMTVADSVKKFFHNNGIHSTTIQIEHDGNHPQDSQNPDVNCLLSCPTDGDCLERTCCGRNDRRTKTEGSIPNQRQPSIGSLTIGLEPAQDEASENDTLTEIRIDGSANDLLTTPTTKQESGDVDNQVQNNNNGSTTLTTSK